MANRPDCSNFSDTLAYRIILRHLLCPDLRREGHYEMIGVVYLSVCPPDCLFVACCDLTRERKGLGSLKLAEWKPIKQVTREPI